MRSIVFILTLVCVSLAAKGFDAIDALSSSKFECMKKNGHSFYISRVYHSSGTVDTTGIQNMKNAWAGGMSHVDGYIFPCVKCGNPAGQIQTAVNALKKDGVKYGMLWLDIEIYAWSSDHTTNRNFIMDLAKELNALKVDWGVYSSYNNWQSIVGVDWTGVSNRPLWWATYNNEANFNNFHAFGGWTKPSIHQYAGDVKGPCSFQTDYNWYP